MPSAPEPLPSSEQAFPAFVPAVIAFKELHFCGNSRCSAASGRASLTWVAAHITHSQRAKRFTHMRASFSLRLSLTVRGVWDDNIFITHSNKVSGYYFAIEPAITIGWGRHRGAQQKLSANGLHAERYSVRRSLGSRRI